MKTKVIIIAMLFGLNTGLVFANSDRDGKTDAGSVTPDRTPAFSLAPQYPHEAGFNEDLNEIILVMEDRLLVPFVPSQADFDDDPAFFARNSAGLKPIPPQEADFSDSL
jgi:hypothetical protein